jgi:integrase
MSTKVLTARAVMVARPKRNAVGVRVRNEIPDGGCPGLYLVVEPTGTKSWAHRYRRRGVPKKDTLGRAGEGGLALAAARHAVAAARHRLGRGGDPATAPHPVAPAGVAANENIEAAVAAFLELHAYRKTRLNSAQATEYSFNRFVLPAWRGRPVAGITRRDVIDLVETVAAAAPYSANRLLAALSKFFNWLRSRDVLSVSPAAGVERPHKEIARQRTLDDGELRALWRACEGEGPFGAALRLMLLTGARRNEASKMPWAELDRKRRLWLLPSTRTKNERPHEIPLSSQAWTILEALPQINGSEFVFTTDGRTPVVGWAKVKARISAKAGLDATTWRLHDLRRTAASGMQRLGVSVPVVEKALNHQGGVFRGIVSTYQTHDYADDVRIAFQKWGDHVADLVSGRKSVKGQVVDLRGRRR